MIIQLVILFLLLSGLFLLSKKISTYIYFVFYILTKNKDFSIGVLSFLLLPGTIIHEMSHFLLATLLRVPTGKMTILPKIEKDGRVKAGRLYLAKTDPLRHMIIGTAPMFIGLMLIHLVGKYLLPYLSLRELSKLSQAFYSQYVTGDTTVITLQRLMTTYKITPLSILGLYLLFIISNTMFSSKKDLESFWTVVPILSLILISIYLAGVRVVFSGQVYGFLSWFVKNINYYLFISIIQNYLVFSLSAITTNFLKKIFGNSKTS